MSWCWLAAACHYRQLAGDGVTISMMCAEGKTHVGRHQSAACWRGKGLLLVQTMALQSKLKFY
jgi:hypothetical protein